MAFLNQIVEDTRKEIAAAKKKRSIGDLKRMIRDLDTPRSFEAALSQNFGLIAEIKRKSPSAGDMRQENVEKAAVAYSKSTIVKAISVLTNSTHFGMSIEELARVKEKVKQPVLRKDFIISEYQVYEARAFGADAILLMANVLTRTTLQRLFDLAKELELDVLFEAHTKEEIEMAPEGTTIFGINSRKFMASHRWRLARLLSRSGWWRSSPGPDPSVELQAFSLINDLPNHAIKVAESGVKPARVNSIRDKGFDAVLVGTSLLKNPAGIESALSEFEAALSTQAQLASASPVVVAA